MSIAPSQVIAPRQFIAHRGYQQYYPENTSLSIVKAIEAGALHVELDVRLSKDHIPMIYHDESLERVSGQKGNVYEFTAKELQNFSAYEPQRLGDKYIAEKISTLAGLTSIAKQYPQVTFYVELKKEAAERHGGLLCVQQIKKSLAPVLEQCVLMSFHGQALVEARALGFKRIGWVTRYWENRNREIEQLNAEILFINKNRLPKTEDIQADCPVVVYEIETVEEALSYFKRGASKVESYRLGNLLPAKKALVYETSI